MPYLKSKYKNVIDRTIPLIKNKIYEIISELEIKCFVTPEPVPFAKRTVGKEKVIKISDKWGELWDCAWFHFKGQVPSSAQGKSIVLLIDISGEALIFDDNGCPIRGLTNVSSNFELSLGLPGKRVYQLTSSAKGDEVIDLWADAGCNDLFGSYKGDGRLVNAHIAICNEEIRNLFYDFVVLNDLKNCLDEKSAIYNTLLFKLYEVSNMLDTFSEDEIKAAREMLGKELAKKCGDTSLSFSAVGHAHLDLAWLWPIRETIRKGARTFATAVDLINRYEDYIFGASQPQLYEWIKKYYPALYKKVGVKVKEGRWDVQGAMWVEPDTNIISGESLVRQVLYGKRFFKEEFGKDVNNLWLPDVFGYSGALPQILKKSGVDYFMTQKLSWSEHNKFPHHTFMWQGIDNTEMLVHMLPEETYNGPLTPSAIKKAEYNFIDSGLSDEALILFGIGDGGGGPGPEHLERAKRVKNLSGLCPVKQDLAENFFKRIDKDTQKLKKWKGELYLERHQGTYTTQAKNKLYNRKMELALRELEFMLVLVGDFENYPKARLDEIWKEVLLYQFHDIIPGSSIKRVYDESLERYEILYKEVNELIEKLSKQIAKNGNANIAFNSLSWDREEIVEIENKYYQVKVSALGYTQIEMQEINEFSIQVTCDTLENENIKVRFNEDGSISSVYDKINNKESIKSSANILSVYEDLGDCWDIPITYTDKKPKSFTLVEQRSYVKGYEAIMEQTYQFGNSKIIQKVCLKEGKKRVDFVTYVDWQENLKMLRTSFPVTIMANNASYEIQFGKIERSTNENTLWDVARFETCGQKWVDLSQDDYGVALLNDCKYGHRIFNSTLDLNLLRSQNYPGEMADRGEHYFTYSLYPHKGNDAAGEVSKEAYELNVPLRIVKGKELEQKEISFINTVGNVIIDTIKKAEDTDDTIIRLYEPYGNNAKVKLAFNKVYKKISFCNLLEEEDIEIVSNTDCVEFEVKPFEIITFKMKK